MVVHYGPNMYSGHYVAFVRIAEQWYLFDDKKVNCFISNVVCAVRLFASPISGICLVMRR